MNIFTKFFAWLKSLFRHTPTEAPLSAWHIGPINPDTGQSYSIGMPSLMAVSPEGYHYFDFPASDGVHYVTAAAPKMAVGRTITMRFAIEGDAKLVPTQGDPPAKVRLYFERTGDTMTAAEQFKRWWSAPLDLAPGDYTLSATVSPEQWSDVFGHSGTDAPQQFADCVANTGNIGFTFGGTFAGHGVYAATGSARFVLKSYEVA